MEMLETMKGKVKNGYFLGNIIDNMKNEIYILKRKLEVYDDRNDYRLKSKEMELQFARQTIELLKHRLRSREHLPMIGKLALGVEEEENQTHENGEGILECSFS